MLWCLATLCLSPLPGSWLIDHLPFPIRDTESAASVLGWQNAAPRPGTVLLGSSRLGSFVRTRELNSITRELSPAAFTPVFNAAVSCGDPITLEFVSRRLLATAAPPPRLAVLEISPDLLARNNRYFKFVITRELKTIDLPKYIPDIMLSHTGISRLLSSRLTPFYLHRTELLAWLDDIVTGAPTRALQKRTTPDALEGNSFQKLRNMENKDPMPLAKRMQRGANLFEADLRNYELEGITSEAFEATVAGLNAQGCNVVLLLPPLSSFQRALFKPRIRESFQQFVQRLQQRYTCDFIDFSERLPDEFFVDNHHASNAGSLRFTELLAREVVAPNWEKVCAAARK